MTTRVQYAIISTVSYLITSAVLFALLVAARKAVP